MEKVKKLLIVERSKYPDNNGKYVLCYIQKTKRGVCWRGIFKGSKKECIEKKLVMLNESIL